MTVTRVSTSGTITYYGLSSDPKPAAPAGSTFIETDTGDTYLYSGSIWFKPASLNPTGGTGGGGIVDQGAAGTAAWPVAPQQIIATTATLTNVTASATSVQLLAANTARVGASIVNDTDKVLRVKAGATASATSYSKILGLKDTNGIGGQWDTDASYTGRVDGIWDSGPTGAARVTEYT